MRFANASHEPAATEIFAAVLTPHRSLNDRGFKIVLAALAVLSLCIGLGFFMLGAWPVPGFMGLDVLAVYVAFRLSYRSGRAAEEISVSRERLTVRRVAASGAASVMEFDPYWTRLEVDRRPPFGITRMRIASRGKSLGIGGFLGPAERETLATALSEALAKVRSVAPP